MSTSDNRFSTFGQSDGFALGTVVGGSLSEGIEIKLNDDVSVEDIPVGSYVVIQGETKRFFGMVNEVRLATTDARLRTTPANLTDPYVTEVLSGTAAYGTITVRPRLLLPMVAGAEADLAPARTVPAHFARASKASDSDVAQVFGFEDSRHFAVGTPLDMEAVVCLDLKSFLERSNGVFGKSGTGKSFLTRLLLIGVLQSQLSSLLIFDMHDEYGWAGSDAERGTQVKGLKQLFPAQVAVFALDAERSMSRPVKPDVMVEIGYGDIEPEDIMVLRETLNISEVAAESSYSLERYYGKRKWLRSFLDLDSRDDIFSLANAININTSALASFHSRLTNRFARLPFLVEKPKQDSVQELMDQLDKGNHVVLEFGRYGDDVPAYMLVANLLTRRIYARYRDRQITETPETGKRTTPLSIVIEEAHRFLSPAVASQSTFGIIAREMRKYNVTLLVVDQRPSGIDPEVMSQIATKVCCLLDDERDVDAVMTGTSGSRELRSVLAGLESKQQALVFGNAVPIPVAVRVRDYGTSDSYDSLMRVARHRRPAGSLAEKGSTSTRPKEDDDDELFG